MLTARALPFSISKNLFPPHSGWLISRIRLPIIQSKNGPGHRRSSRSRPSRVQHKPHCRESAVQCMYVGDPEWCSRALMAHFVVFQLHMITVFRGNSLIGVMDTLFRPVPRSHASRLRPGSGLNCDPKSSAISTSKKTPTRNPNPKSKIGLRKGVSFPLGCASG